MATERIRDASRGRRFRFTILDGLAAVVVVAITIAAFQFYSEFHDRESRGEIAVWLVTTGVAVVLGLVYRLGLAREARLLVLGLAVAFAGVADGLYLAMYVRVEGVAVATVLGLAVVASVLLAGALFVERRDRPAGRPPALMPLSDESGPLPWRDTASASSAAG